jgi:hypothetical protein
MLNEIPQEDFLVAIPAREQEDGFNKPLTAARFYTGDLGPFTVVVIADKKSIHAGIAKRNPCDRPNPETGFAIAAVRAFRDFQGKNPGYSRQHPVSRSQAKRIAIDAAVNEVLDELGDILDD